MPKDFPDPPDANGVMTALTKVGFLFEQIETAAGNVGVEITAYQRDYAEWEKAVQAYQREEKHD